MKNLKLTLKAWPVIAFATIGLCFLTQLVAGWFGVELKEQPIILQLRQGGIHAWQVLTQQGLGTALNDEIARKFLINIPLIIVFAPVVEEIIFRLCLWKLPTKLFGLLVRNSRLGFLAPAAAVILAILASAVFSSAHFMDKEAFQRTGEWAWMPLNNGFLALGFFGLAQCWLYEKTSWLWSPMLNHLLFNITNLVLLFVLPIG